MAKMGRNWPKIFDGGSCWTAIVCSIGKRELEMNFTFLLFSGRVETMFVGVGSIFEKKFQILRNSTTERGRVMSWRMVPLRYHTDFMDFR